MPIDIEKCKLLTRFAASGHLKQFKELLAREDVDVNYHPRNPWRYASSDDEEDHDAYEDEDDAETAYEEDIEEDDEESQAEGENGDDENEEEDEDDEDGDDAEANERPVEFPDYTGTALYHAIENGREAIAQIILGHPDWNVEAFDVLRPGNANLNALSHAISRKSQAIVFALLAKGADINLVSCVDEFGSRVTALGHAVISQDKKLVEILLQHEDVDVLYAPFTPVLHCAIESSTLEILNLLLDKGADPNQVDMAGTTAFECAMFRSLAHPDFGFLEVCETLLRHGAKMSFADYLFMNPEVEQFGERNSLPGKMSSLLTDGFDINYKGIFDVTPLMLAAANGYGVISAKMIEKGADITAMDMFGRNAMTIAVQFGHSKVLDRLALARETRLLADKFLGAVERNDTDAVRELVKLRKIDFNNTDESGKAPLSIVSECDRLEMAKIILGKNVRSHEGGHFGRHAKMHDRSDLLPDIEAKDHSGNTALAHACLKQGFSTAKFLLENGANINAADHDGNTILMNSCAHHCVDAAEFLLTNGADFALRNNSGQTALMRSCAHLPSSRIVHLMLDHGADIDAVDHAGRSVFDYLGQNYEDLYANSEYTSVKALLDHRRWEKNGFPDDENLNLSFQGDPSNPSPALPVRTPWFDEMGEMPDKKMAFQTFIDTDDLVQLASMASLLDEPADGYARWSTDAMELPMADALDSLEQECVFDPWAMDYQLQ